MLDELRSVASPRAKIPLARSSAPASPKAGALRSASPPPANSPPTPKAPSTSPRSAAACHFASRSCAPPHPSACRDARERAHKSALPLHHSVVCRRSRAGYAAVPTGGRHVAPPPGAVAAPCGAGFTPATRYQPPTTRHPADSAPPAPAAPSRACKSASSPRSRARVIPARS